MDPFGYLDPCWGRYQVSRPTCWMGKRIMGERRSENNSEVGKGNVAHNLWRYGTCLGIESMNSRTFSGMGLDWRYMVGVHLMKQPCMYTGVCGVKPPNCDQPTINFRPLCDWRKPEGTVKNQKPELLRNYLIYKDSERSPSRDLPENLLHMWPTHL